MTPLNIDPNVEGDDQFEEARQEFDNLAFDRSDSILEKTTERLRSKAIRELVPAIVAMRFGVAKEKAKMVPPGMLGSFNVAFPAEIEDNPLDFVVRMVIPDAAQFPDEKTISEVAVARFIRMHTFIPTPAVLYYGLSTENPDFGTYIIMEHIRNVRSFSHTCMRPVTKPDETHMLDTLIPKSKLRHMDVQMANYLLQLIQHRFPRIGSLVQTGRQSWDVRQRPLALNMNDMIQLANIPHSALPPKEKMYQTADEWYVALAKMNMACLLFQHNDFVSKADDCRNKYVARQIFHRLAKQGKLSSFGFVEDDWSAQSRKAKSVYSFCSAPDNSGSFPLWCDDLRAGNILVGETDNIVALIDWEFTYAGPTQFSLDPPWWLLLDIPEMWLMGIEDWAHIYDERVQTWFEAMEEAEKDVDLAALQLKAPLSMYMRQSWETGRFWMNYAARKGWAFDTIYWKYLDERFFGERLKDVPKEELWRTRIGLMTNSEREAMELFVAKKMEESKERILIDGWDPEEVKKRFAEVLFDE